MEGIQYLKIVLITLQALFSLYVVIIFLYVTLNRPKTINGELYIGNSPKNNFNGRVGILLPFFREKKRSIYRTINSILKQSYPRDKISIYFIVNHDDDNTNKIIEEAYQSLNEYDIKAKIIRVETNRRKGKPAAINQALKHVDEEHIIIFDADDSFPSDYLNKTVSLLQNNDVSAVTTKVYRLGEGLLSSLLTIDTILWYDVILPLIYNIGSVIPLSGEGLAIKKSYIQKMGGFPEKLTEDAFLSIKIAEKRGKTEYLSNSFIIERTPKNIIAHLKQRIRWIQGFYESLVYLLLRTGRIPLRPYIGLLLAFISPLLAVGTLFSHTLFLSYWLSQLVGNHVIPSFIIKVFSGLLFYWSFSNLVLGNLLLFFVLLYTVLSSRFNEKLPYVYLMPFYWYYIGFVSFISLFLPRRWHKTQR